MPRPAAEKGEFHQRKVAAVEFYRLHGVPQAVENALNELFVLRPGDVYGHLADYFTRLAAPPRITGLRGSEVYDARGQLSMEAEVFCLFCNKEKSASTIAAPAPLAPKGISLECKAESQDRADHVTAAAKWINQPLGSMLKDKNPCDQSQVDQILSGFLTACVLEQSVEAESPSPPSPSPPSSQQDKRSADKGKKNSAADSPSCIADPPEAALPGSMAIGALSLTVAKMAARVQGLPLYRHIAALRDQVPEAFHIPVPLITLLGCGKTSPGKLSLMEEVILIPKMGQPINETIAMTLGLQKEMTKIMNSSTKGGATVAVVCDSGALAGSFERAEQPLDVITEACGHLGLGLGSDLHLALNCAAPMLMDHAKGKYEIATGLLKTPDELVDTYQTLVHKYPAVVALIDPFRREDERQWERLCEAVGDSCSLLSDVTHSPQDPPPPGVRGHVLELSNHTTVSDIIHGTGEHKASLLMRTTHSESCWDSSLADIAVGLGLDYVRLGGLSGAERMTKYNRLISIERELAQQGRLGISSSFFTSLYSSLLEPDREKGLQTKPEVVMSLSLPAGSERTACVRNHTSVRLCVCRGKNAHTHYLESVNWLPNYTQGQTRSHSCFLKGPVLMRDKSTSSCKQWPLLTFISKY
ncbi:enolase 4 [Menidia menidia]